MSLLAEQRRIEREEAAREAESRRLTVSMAADPDEPQSNSEMLSLPASTSSPRPSATSATSPCARSMCSSARTASPAKTRARRKSCSTTSRSPRPPSVATSTTSATAPAELMEALKAGGRIAVVSDAGMPGISDPGSWLVREAIAAGVAGDSHSRRQCGAQRAGRFRTADGRVPLPRISAGKGRRAAHPARSSGRRDPARPETARTLIFYEAPHRILETLADLEAVLGPRPARRRCPRADQDSRGVSARNGGRSAAGARRARSHSRRDHAAGRSADRSRNRQGRGAATEKIADRVPRLQAESGIDEKEALKRIGPRAGPIQERPLPRTAAGTRAAALKLGHRVSGVSRAARVLAELAELAERRWNEASATFYR